jgi:hypothetical protein
VTDLQRNDICFDASKSKYVIIHSKRARCCNLRQYGIACSPRFKINGNDIELVDSFRRLGYVINSEFYDTDDIVEKRAIFIKQVNNFCVNLVSKVPQLSNYYLTITV